MRIGIGQLNMIVGDLPGNRDKIISAIRTAKDKGVELLVLPELVLLGYPPRDLLHRRGFLEAAGHEFHKIVGATEGIGLVMGHVVVAGKREGNQVDPSAAAFGGDVFLHNAAFLIADGEIIGYQGKKSVPSFDVFEEERYFTPPSRSRYTRGKGCALGFRCAKTFGAKGA